MCRKILILVLIFIMIASQPILAVTNSISCNVEVDFYNVTIAGTLPNVANSHNVMLLIGTWDHIIYTDVTESLSNGNFVFQFKFPKTLASGEYPFQIGTDAGIETYTGTINYYAPVREQIFNVDFTASIVSHIPTISGTVSCADGKTVVVNVVDKSNGATLIDDIIDSEDGVVNVAYTFPDLSMENHYQILIACEDDSELVNMSFTLNTSTYESSFYGTVDTANFVDIESHVETVPIDLISKDIIFTGHRDVSETLPNMSIPIFLHLTTTGYETVVETENDPDNDDSYIADSIGKVVAVGIEAKDISDINNKVFNVTFDSTKLELVDLVGQTYAKELTSGVYENISILSVSDNNIRFSVTLPNQNENHCWNGIVNLIKFKVHDYAPVTVTVEE